MFDRGLAPSGADAAGGGGMPGGGLTGRLPVYPALSLPSCPHPPDPLPLRGRGSPKVYFAGGFAPGTPVAVPVRRWRLVGGSVR